MRDEVGFRCTYQIVGKPAMSFNGRCVSSKASCVSSCLQSRAGAALSFNPDIYMTNFVCRFLQNVAYLNDFPFIHAIPTACQRQSPKRDEYLLLTLLVLLLYYLLFIIEEKKKTEC